MKELNVSTHMSERWAMEPFPTLQPEVYPRPYGYYEGLMQNYDGETVEELYPLRLAVIDALDSLTDYETYVFEASHYRGMSVRAIGRELGRSKSSVFRARQRAVAKLQARLRDNPTVRGYLSERP